MRRKRGEVSLARALSKLGAASRSEARRLIAAGEVAVGGVAVVDPEAAVRPEAVEIRVRGRPLARPPFRMLMLHKPRGVVTTRRDPAGRPTVFELLPEGERGLVCVGRLDFATSGLLLLTSSTRLADWLTSPVNAVSRVYLATVRGRWGDAEGALAKAGVDVDGERLRAVEVVGRKVSGRESHLVVTLAEGKNREVRRLLAALGHEVTKLKRVAFGGLELGDLAPGAWRVVPAPEARRALGAPAPLG